MTKCDQPNTDSSGYFSNSPDIHDKDNDKDDLNDAIDDDNDDNEPPSTTCMQTIFCNYLNDIVSRSSNRSQS